MEKAIVNQVVPLQLMEVNGKADIHLQPMENPMPEQVDAPEGGCGPWEAHVGASSWQDLWTRGERSPCWSRFAGRTCDPVGDSRWSSLFLKDCTLWKGLMLEQFMKNCSLWEGLMLEKFVEDCLLWVGLHIGVGAEEGAAETMCDELTATPIPHPPVLLGGRRLRSWE
ncbi:zinc finger and BTB domain-containing protein 5 [Grus japonensis]|uniref:Zinc finger and BTB domain-containing protein 5 n=1 Tax=Grus japonensis TaxID=30415 RepID=A0ABC9Y2R3_GRUJA